MDANQVPVVIVEALSRLIHSQKYLETARTESRYFTRKRCLALVDYVVYLLTSANRSLQVGLNLFLQNRKICSKQAFSQGRRHIKNEAFLQLAECVRDQFYALTKFLTWHGYRLLAVDGTKFNLAYSAKLMSRFGAQASSGNQIQCLLSAVYDVLNGQILNILTDRHNGSERRLFEEQLTKNSCFQKGKDVFIFDRGYPSAALLDTLDSLGHLFVIRCDSNFLNAIQIEKPDCVIDYRFTKSKQKRKYRIITVQLENGRAEQLITNLFASTLTVDDFAELYHFRWGIEQCFQILKSPLEAENLSGLDEQTFLQDLYANMTIINLSGVFNYASSIQISQQNHHRRYAVKQNRRVLTMTLKASLVVLLTTRRSKYLLQKVSRLLLQMSRSLVDIRPRRSFPRKLHHPCLSFPTNQRH